MNSSKIDKSKSALYEKLAVENWGETPNNIYVFHHSISFLAHYRFFNWGLSPQISSRLKTGCISSLKPVIR